VRHGFARLSPDMHQGLARIQAIDVRAQGHDLDAVQHSIRGVVADDHGGPPFADLATTGRIKVNPIDVPTPHSIASSGKASIHSQASRSRSSSAASSRYAASNSSSSMTYGRTSPSMKLLIFPL